MLYLCVLSASGMRHVMRGSTKILYHVMWQLFYVLFLFDFVNLNSGNVFLCTFFFYSAWSVFFCNPPLPVFATTHSIKLQSLTCVISATVFFLQSQHISGQGCLQSSCIFTKLQPHQAKTKLVTPSFFTSFCNRNHIAIRGCNHTET
jgi:hypothetical protein